MLTRLTGARIRRKKMLEAAVMVAFGVPIISLCALYVSEARRLALIEAAREAVRRENRRLRIKEAMRRTPRGTP